jgi:5-methylcytosine-specific restriction endonuclease McrBC regulatory subunit McrC
MIQDPNVERIIRKSIEPLNKQISMLQIELNGVKEQLAIPRVSKRFSYDQMIEASRYGYNYRDTTSFPNKNFDDNCKNNTRQWLTTLK